MTSLRSIVSRRFRSATTTCTAARLGPLRELGNSLIVIRSDGVSKMPIPRLSVAGKVEPVSKARGMDHAEEELMKQLRQRIPEGTE